MVFEREKTAWLVLRIGVAFAFLYAGIGGFVDPQSWLGWFPKFMRDLVPEMFLLQIWGVYEIVTGLWILSGKNIFVPRKKQLPLILKKPPAAPNF